MIDLVGKNLGPYQLQNAILQGGMATVYRAYQPLLERYVAVKVMFPNVDPQFAQRFAREARAVAQLQHPNIVQIYDFGEQDGQFYIAMQYIENGRSLNEFKGQMLPIEQALKIAASTLSALDHAHKRGIVHRDIKPSNILLAGDMWPMLSDFGISHFVKDTDSTNLTASGMIIGTPAYMAPEQAEGRSVDARSDLYALGVVLYELLTGHVPFRADTSMGMLAARLTQQPRPPREYRDELPLVVEAMIMRALARRPEARYQTADEMFREVQQTLSAMQLDRSGLALEPSGSSYVPPVDSSVHTRAAREIHTTSLPVPLVPSTSQSSVSQPESREKVSDSYVPATAVKWLAGGLLLLALLIAIPLLLTNKVVLLPTTNSTLYLILTFALCSIICWILVTSLLTGITKPVYTQLRKLRRQVPQNAPASTAASEPSFYTFSGAQTPTIVGSSVRQQPTCCTLLGIRSSKISSFIRTTNGFGARSPMVLVVAICLPAMAVSAVPP
jgi:serine/threonine protein kinase